MEIFDCYYHICIKSKSELIGNSVKQQEVYLKTLSITSFVNLLSDLTIGNFLFFWMVTN